MYHMQRPQLCAGHGQRHRPIKVGMAMRQLKLRGSAGPSSRRPDASHATWTRARPAWPAPVRWLGQRARWWAAGGAGATIRPSRARDVLFEYNQSLRTFRPNNSQPHNSALRADLCWSKKSSTISGLRNLYFQHSPPCLTGSLSVETPNPKRRRRKVRRKSTPRRPHARTRPNSSVAPIPARSSLPRPSPSPSPSPHMTALPCARGPRRSTRERLAWRRRTGPRRDHCHLCLPCFNI